LPVKENQPTLRADIQAAFADPEAGLSPPLQVARRAACLDRATTLDKGHGRIEKRAMEVTTLRNLVIYLCSFAGTPSLAAATRHFMCHPEKSIELVSTPIGK
jgi:hypothetical protein